LRRGRSLHRMPVALLTSHRTRWAIVRAVRAWWRRLIARLTGQRTATDWRTAMSSERHPDDGGSEPRGAEPDQPERSLTRVEPDSDRNEAEDVSPPERPYIPDTLPVLPLRDSVLFPNAFMPPAVAREASVRLIDESMTGSRLIAVFTQRD